MKHLALAIAAVLTLSLVAPVLAQPFADVPADHWAFDAIAELAAKGILEGYPDGTFKGDRAMTRYEMAMALARILARIEAVQKAIPRPVKIPPPEVTRADIARLQRLLNEFRAELSALGVRITAIEEDLAALRARVAADTTTVTGDWTYVYAASSIPTVALNRARLTFRGSPAPGVSVFLRATWSNFFGPAAATSTTFDRVLAAWVSPWGLTFTAGRDYWGVGDVGILLAGRVSTEGFRAVGTFGGIAFTALGFFNASGCCGDGATYGLRATLPAVAGWNFGFNYRSDRTYGLPTPVGPVAGSGFSVDFRGSLVGMTVTGEYASWAPSAGCPAAGVVATISYGCTALFVNAAINLAALGVSQLAPTLNVAYRDYKAFYDTICGGTTCTATFNTVFGGSNTLVTSWSATLGFQVTPRVSAVASYEAGAINGGTLPAGFAAGDRYNGVAATGTYTLSRTASLSLTYARVANLTTPLPATISPTSWTFVAFFRW